MKARFYRNAAGLWRWEVIARNGRVIANSATQYTTLQNAQKGARLTGGALLGASHRWTIDR